MPRKSVAHKMHSREIEEMLAIETRCVSGLLRRARKTAMHSLGHHDTRLQLTAQEFVERSYSLHRNLVKAWGGWHYHAAPIVVNDPDFHVDALSEVWSQWHDDLRSARSCSDLTYTDYQVLGGLNTLRTKRGMPLSYAALSERLLSKSRVQEAYARAFERDLPPKEPLYISLGPESIPIRVGQRVAAVVLRAVRERVKAGKLSPVCFGLVDSLFQRLGERVWTHKKQSLAITLTCAPSAFLMLGHYGEKSCLQHGGGSAYSKYWLAADCPDSFVMLGYRVHEGDLLTVSRRTGRRRGLPSARAWGIARLADCVYFSNFYLLEDHVVLPTMKLALPAAFGVKGKAEGNNFQIDRISRVLVNGPCVYLNDDGPLFVGVDASQATVDDLVNILSHSSHFGLFGHHGRGPARRGRYGPLYPATRPKCWPYPDISMVRQARLFLPRVTSQKALQDDEAPGVVNEDPHEEEE